MKQPILLFGLACQANIQSQPDAGVADAESPQEELELDLVGYVNPFIGTDDSNSPSPVPGGAGGSTYPGATVPFGMVQLSPDTPTASPSGYRYSDTSIEQFSLTHLNGAGCANNEDLPFLPFVGELNESPGTSGQSYQSEYSKETEQASPGYYRVDLYSSGIQVELTTTTRTGMARFTFPKTTEAQILVYPGRSATGDRDGHVKIIAPDQIEGSATCGGFCGTGTSFEIYFAMVVDQPIAASGTWQESEITKDSSKRDGHTVGAYLTFDTTTVQTVQMKMGLSYVSIANARENLQAENPDWDFDLVRAAAAAEWNSVLNRIQVTGGADTDLGKFYTALYHVFQNPNVANDVNGDYMGSDGQVHKTSRTLYHNYSGWDIIRSWTHLIAAVAPEAPDIIHSMVQHGIERGLLPFWTHQNVETQIMVGDPGTVVVANAYAMGVRDFDTAAALALMEESANNPSHTHRWFLSDWINLHYVSNAAMTLEYAMADFALAQFADALGESTTADRYFERSDYWKESWNEADGYIEPRTSPSGEWGCQALDPASQCGFIEGNAAQYVWMVPHNLEALFSLMGGHSTAVTRLDDLFLELNAGTSRPYFYIGNEPEHGTPWTYVFAGAPEKTQETVRRIVEEQFDAAPGGLPGNDDLGSTSAWLIWAYLGLYPMIPGTDILVLHGPYFDSATVQLANGNTITTSSSQAGAPYVESVSVSGVPTTQSWLHFSDVLDGATLDFTMGETPGTWATDPKDLPPSFDPGI